MEKRLLLTIVLCLGLFIGWALLFPQQPQHVASGPEQKSAQTSVPPTVPRDRPGEALTGSAEAPPTAPLAPQPSAAPAAPAAAAASAPAAASAAAAGRPPEQVVVVEQPGLFRAELSSWGGRIRSFELLDPQYRVGGEQRSLLEIVDGWLGRGEPRPQGEPRPIDLVSVKDEAFWPLGLTLPRSGIELSGREAYEVVSRSPQEVVFRYQDPAGRATIEKVFRFRPDSYVFDLEIRVANRSAGTMSRIITLMTDGWQDPTKAKGSLFTPALNLRSAVCYVRDEMVRQQAAELSGKGWETQSGEVLWSGTEDQYFLQAVLPPESLAKGGMASCSFIAENNVVLTSYSAPATEVAPGQSSAESFRIYFGPKNFYGLKEVGQKLQLAVDFRWGWLRIICEPMLWLMRLFYGWTGNWGVAIIFLTLFVKLAMFYFTNKSFESMASMQKLKPEMDALRKKYENDKQRLNQEMINLYKQHKVNPLGGCLPMLLQMPIYFALYQTIFSSAELYRAPFFLHIQDLTAPDPYFITPLLLGVIMWLQQKITPTAMDSAQAKMMLWMMPIMFTAFMLFLPAGLVIYILANSVLTIAQQMLIQRRRLAKA